jgi:hypothetical protein
MSTYLLRILVYVFLPLVLAALHVRFDREARTRERRLELFLLYMLGIGVGANGIGGFSGHLFASEQVARAIGWPAGNPFQLEVGFANLALGILGVVAIGRRDGFREATVVAVTVFSVGATIVHIVDIVATGNLAPGNTVQNVGNLLRPALLIFLLVASRRADRDGELEQSFALFQEWRAPLVNWVSWFTGGLSMGFGIGLALGWGVRGALLGIAAGAAVAWAARATAPRSAP